MNGIKKIRNQLGINQQDLADYLGVVRSAIALAETNRQQLPIDALLKLNEFFLKLPNDIAPQNIPLAINEITKQETNLNFFLQEQQIINTRKIKQLQKQLIDLQTNYKKAVQLLQAVRQLKQQTSDTAKNKKDILWLSVAEAMAIEKIRANGLIAQQKIQTLINRLSIV